MSCRTAINGTGATHRRGFFRVISSAPSEPGDCGCPLWPKHDIGGDQREPIPVRATRKMAATVSAEPDLTRFPDTALVETHYD